MYYAFHKETPDALVQKFQTALAQLSKGDGEERSEYDRIVESYLGPFSD
jgi:hypothetical protein